MKNETGNEIKTPLDQTLHLDQELQRVLRVVIAREQRPGGLLFSMDTRKLEELAEDWDRAARRKFFDAEHEQSEFGRRFIEHGAMCYINCSAALRKALDIKVQRKKGE